MDSNRSFYTAEIALSSFFVLSWTFGFSREFTNDCFSVTFWVLGALILHFLRALCICCKGSIGGDHGAPLLGMIIIWSVLGNIIIGTSIRCAPFNTPIMFYTSIGYIGIVDLFILVWLVANCTKGPNAARPHPILTSPSSNNDNTELTAEQSKYWSWWLAYYGCAEVECCPPQLATETADTCIDDPSLISSPATAFSASETSVSTPASVSIHCTTESVCSICLAPLRPHSVVSSSNNYYSLLESGGILKASASSSITHTTTNLVARFPCTGGHIFHSVCLKLWLEAASSMDVECADNNKQVTCPNCREKPRIIC